MSEKIANCMVKIIRLYQNAAPSWMRKMCRYTPTCSEYAILILREKGAIKGSLLAAARIMRCIPPFGGIDWPNKHDINCHSKRNAGKFHQQYRNQVMGDKYELD